MSVFLVLNNPYSREEILTDTKTDTRLWFWGSFRNARSSLDYSVEGDILTLQTRQTQPDSVPRLQLIGLGV